MCIWQQTLLYKMKLTNTKNTCTFCNIEMETIKHIFGLYKCKECLETV